MDETSRPVMYAREFKTKTNNFFFHFIVNLCGLNVLITLAPSIVGFFNSHKDMISPSGAEIIK